MVSDSGVRLAEWMAVAGMASLGPRARGVMSILLMRDHEDEAALVSCGVDAGRKRRGIRSSRDVAIGRCAGGRDGAARSRRRGVSCVLISSQPRHGEWSGKGVPIGFSRSRHADRADRLTQGVHVPIGTGATISPKRWVAHPRIDSSAPGAVYLLEKTRPPLTKLLFRSPSRKSHDQPYQKE